MIPHFQFPVCTNHVRNAIIYDKRLNCSILSERKQDIKNKI
jgi:hypothetical protein